MPSMQPFAVQPASVPPTGQNLTITSNVLAKNQDGPATTFLNSTEVKSLQTEGIDETSKKQ